MSRPRLLDQPVTEADIREYLATQDDLGLEMECVQLCRDRQWEVNHGGTYTDPVTKKTRQFDIRAQKLNRDRRVYLRGRVQGTYPIVPACDLAAAEGEG